MAMTPMAKALIAQVSPELANRIDQAERIHGAIGSALTPEQQLKVSSKIVNGPEEFIEWIKTDKGKSAIRELADKFTSD